jgi:glycosyltransferase involved in cell wall biosynthesis
MRISIITPSYNQGDYIDRTIQSVLDQTGDFELEYIVIDGGSTDRTLEILKRYEGRLRWVSEKDRGQAHALNKGLREVTGEVVGWINSDDRYEAGAFQKVCDAFRRQSGSQWIVGRCRIIDERDREFRRMITRYKNRCLDRYSYDRFLTENFISQPATFFKRSFARDVGPLNEALHFTMDYDLWLRMGAKADPVILKDYLASFRYYAGTKTHSSLSGFLPELHALSRQYAGGRRDILLRGWLSRTRTQIVYRLLNRIEQ